MKSEPLASIIINNYNYGRFLPDAINSALNQTYPYIEVIVVDDGSNDSSREIIASYKDIIIPLLQHNSGQASALNAGVEASKGELIFFLDADDVFFLNKVEKMLNLFSQVTQENTDVIISNYIQTIDEKGLSIDVDILKTLSIICDWKYLKEIGGRESKLFDELTTRLSTPNQAYQFAAKYRFIPYLGMPTSGIAMTRSLARKIFPIPSGSIKISADDFIVKGASLLGTVYLTKNVLTKYRIHGTNNWYESKNKVPVNYVDTIDNFLNQKLGNIGKKSVFSYLNSIHAKGYYRSNFQDNCSKKLLFLAVNVIVWHINLRTIIFFIKTICLVVILRLKIIINNAKNNVNCLAKQ